MNTQYTFVGLDEDFIPETVNGDFEVTGTIVSAQHIPQGFLDRVAAKRNWQDAQSFSALTKGDDLEKVHLARIPVAVVNKWQREGFDMMELISSGDPNAASIIMAKLRLEDLSAFQVSSKNF
ncbi:hypothetical protein [Sphingobium sp. CCH11-B1]|jgi:hypothetical protein|uniref:hypothetical protein n=1 Tax=Sphingobium sp. CCH11-B1 TaxID=1768781 RepID=UPI0008372C42|nr:hypothetical protein [Sphingobium sp. CCH11-B1]